MASSFFDTMFSLPQSGSLSDPQVVDVTEDSRTMEILLRICYPVRKLGVSGLEEARAVLEAALKYDMDLAILSAKKWLLDLIKEHPLRVYAIACRNRLEDIARAAASTAKVQQAVNDVYVPELEEISAGCYHRLLRYQRESISWPPLIFCHPGRSLMNLPQSGTTGPLSCEAPSPFNNMNADVVIITVDMVRFHVSREFVTLASPVLKRMLEVQDECFSADEIRSKDQAAVRILHVDHDSDTFHALLQLCHPSDAPALDNTDSLPSLSMAAARYEMGKALWILRQRWSEFAASQPLQSYLLALSHEWKKEAIHSAKIILTQDFETLQMTYVDNLETTMAGPYFRLLQYHKRCGEMAKTFISGDFRSHPQIAGKMYTCNYSSPNGYGIAYKPCCTASYIPGMSGDLCKRPCAATVTSGPRFAAMIGEIGSCGWCKTKVELILSFVSALGRAVDDEAAKVDTEMLFLADD